MLRHMIDVAYDWAVRSFPGQMNNQKTRALRLVEEAIELCQAVGVDEGDVLKTLAHVYAGEPGEPYQEMGGVLLTAFLMARCLEPQSSPLDIFSDELRRVLAKDPAIWAARNANKVNVDVARPGSLERPDWPPIPDNPTLTTSWRSRDWWPPAP